MPVISLSTSFDMATLPVGSYFSLSSISVTVIILVIEAGYTFSSIFLEYSVSPVSIDTSIPAFADTSKPVISYAEAVKAGEITATTVKIVKKT